MKTHIKNLLLLAASLSIVAPLRAQVVADGATNTLSNVTNTFTGDVTVGTNGSFTLLVLSDNAVFRSPTPSSREFRNASSGWRCRSGSSEP
jgi:hypothetical protein